MCVSLLSEINDDYYYYCFFLRALLGDYYKERNITRWHDFTVVKEQNRLDVRKYSLSQRAVNVWNK